MQRIWLKRLPFSRSFPKQNFLHTTSFFRQTGTLKLKPLINSRGSFYSRNKKTINLLGTTTTFLILYNTNQTVHDSSQYVIFTTKRITIVGQGTLRCFYHYKKFLKKTFTDKDLRNIELERCHKKCALITLHALQLNGGIFIKFGQHIGAMTYLLPKQWTETMIPLQDQCPESSLSSIEDMFVEDMDISMNDLFEDVNPKPIGVASLAQVYVGTMKGTGQKVAIKCQHPELKDYIPVDVWLTKTVFWCMDKVFPEYPLTWLGDELQSSIYDELDFCKEAQNAINTAEYFKKFKKLTALRIPNVIKADKRILIMEYLEGSRLDDLKYIDQHHISRSEISSCLSHIFNNMIFTPNIGLHCDPHGGNLAIKALPRKSDTGHNFEIILFDHGLYRYPDTTIRRNYAKFWLALLDKDKEGMQKYAKRFANISDREFPLFAAALTGRSIDFVMNYDISKRRSNEEISEMTSGLLEGTFLADIMGILSRIPRIVILILKTNDLTRYLDECLQNPLGPERTFLIMSQYCAKTVFDEEIEELDEEFVNNKKSRWSISWAWKYFKHWISYEKRIKQLVLYDTVIWYKNHVNGLLQLLTI
ncbi:ABC1 protein mcp2 [Monosporozyma unispora]|nr:ABC1 protein mcp2 [Kazachstania unispora]